uniref:hypothetical protein n=1 Tax=Rheinheimera sp. TaxID=1869214 RepID=UPI00404854C7
RRRSKPRVVWLPSTDINSVGQDPNADSVYQQFGVDVIGPTGSFAVGEIPIVIDQSTDAQDPTQSLSDLENSGYRLRRIVGKIWVSQEQVQEETAPSRFIVTAGLIIRREDSTTGLSMAFGTGQAELLAPSQIENSGDPWIWRRSWVLTNQFALPVGQDVGIQNNYTFGSGGVSDGPHVDQKTARIVGPEERLYLDVSSTILLSGAGQQLIGSTTVLTDLRVLASMRTGTGNRRNASR